MNRQVLKPDLSVLLTADPAIIEQRLDERGRTSRFEQMDGIAARELAYFEQAFEFLRNVGYNTLEITTTETTPESGASEIAAHIATLNGGVVAT
jgi:dTMP kinase